MKNNNERIDLNIDISQYDIHSNIKFNLDGFNFELDLYKCFTYYDYTEKDFEDINEIHGHEKFEFKLNYEILYYEFDLIFVKNDNRIFCNKINYTKMSNNQISYNYYYNPDNKTYLYHQDAQHRLLFIMEGNKIYNWYHCHSNVDNIDVNILEINKNNLKFEDNQGHGYDIIINGEYIYSLNEFFGKY